MSTSTGNFYKGWSETVMELESRVYTQNMLCFTSLQGSQSVSKQRKGFLIARGNHREVLLGNTREAYVEKALEKEGEASEGFQRHFRNLRLMWLMSSPVPFDLPPPPLSIPGVTCLCKHLEKYAPTCINLNIPKRSLQIRLGLNPFARFVLRDN